MTGVVSALACDRHDQTAEGKVVPFGGPRPSCLAPSWYRGRRGGTAEVVGGGEVMRPVEGEVT